MKTQAEIMERLTLYENYFIDAGIPPQKMPASDDNFLCRGEFTLMHAHYMTLLAKDMADEGNAMAFYMLGMIETILSMHKLFSTSRMYYENRSS